MKELIITLLSGLVAWMVNIFYNKYFANRPKLAVKYTYEGADRKGVPSENNDWSTPIGVPYMIYFFTFKFTYLITLKNITEYKTSNIIIFYQTGFKWDKLENIDPTKAVGEDEELSLRNQLFYTEEGYDSQVRDYNDVPESLLKLKFAVKYNNKYGISFYTLYDAETDSYKFSIYKPKGFI